MVACLFYGGGGIRGVASIGLCGLEPPPLCLPTERALTRGVGQASFVLLLQTLTSTLQK